MGQMCQFMEELRLATDEEKHAAFLPLLGVARE
jgi:hypothetical protein